MAFLNFILNILTFSIHWYFKAWTLQFEGSLIKIKASQKNDNMQYKGYGFKPWRHITQMFYVFHLLHHLAALTVLTSKSLFRVSSRVLFFFFWSTSIFFFPMASWPESFPCWVKGRTLESIIWGFNGWRLGPESKNDCARVFSRTREMCVKFE